MAIFSRKRASSQPPQPTAPPPSSSAAIAASAAFLNKSTSTASLSSAAAAAALRSHTTSPEPVASLQTKRMVRRGSQSSTGSGTIMTGPRNGMVRQTSNSSMADRTFRSPSPGGRPPSRAGAVSPAPDAPPVPAIPKNIVKQRRSASLEPPQRIMSPTPRSGQRNSSVDRVGKTLTLPSMPELEREDSNRSVNFSRPMSPSQAAALPARPHSSVGWFTSPQTTNGTPRGNPSAARPQSAFNLTSPEATKVQQQVQSAADKPVKKKKKTVTEGARLANGTMNTGPTGTAVQPASSGPQTQASTTQSVSAEITPVKKKKKTTAVPALDTQVSNGTSLAPVNPSPSTDASRSPNSPRAAGTLHKQPSVVREDPEAEATAEVESTPRRSRLTKTLSVKDSGKTIITSEGPVQAYVAPGEAVRPRAVSLDIPRQNGQRAGSLSPSRNVHAHFGEGSSLATPLSIRHQPPPRSVSPMKSALRQSPASSIRTSSPNVGVNPSRIPASDASDTTSMASQDGIKSAKRKKSVRISEDGGAPVSPVVDPNARRELSGNWGNEDIDEIMKPRPALPSFGSVRGRKLQQAEIPEKVTETVSSSMTTSASTLPDRQEVSNDHAVGAVFAQDYAQKDQKSQDPLPPQVTSVEGSGDMSESTYSEDEAESQAHPPAHEKMSASNKQASPTFAPRTSEHNVEAPEANPIELAVPDIAIQPATPGLEEGAEPSLEAPVQKPIKPVLKKRNSMPGAWDEWEEPKPAAQSRQAVRDEVLESETGSSDDEAVSHTSQVPAGAHPPLLQPIYESDSDSDDSAAFSDAAEDLTELDHGGFASLDAIVESPVTKPAPPAIASPPDSPLVKLPPARAAIPEGSSSTQAQVDADNTDWNSATAYWSSLSRSKKQQLEAEAEAAVTSPVTESAPKPKKKKPTQIDITNPKSYAPPDDPFEPEEQPAPRKSALRKSAESERTSTKTHMRKSMRDSDGPAPSSNETHMRTSMRAGGSMRSEGSMRSSMRGDAGSNPKQKRMSAPVAPSNPGAGSAAAAAATIQSQAAQKPTKPVIAPLPAYDSDSESSFKKKRRGSVSTVDSVGKYTMKRSMRSGSVDAGPPPAARERATSPPSKPGTGRFSLRSLSPNGSMMGRNDGEKLRSSLRGAPIDDTPTMRGKNNRASRDSKASSGFSMSGFAKSKPSSAPAPKPRSGGFRSRFADSDDEDDAAARGGFRSRFADSDDEDSPIGPPKTMPANLAPVRGIPKRRGQDSDSTDLSDSEDEPRNGKTKRAVGRASAKPAVPSQSDIDAAMEAAKRNVAAMNGGREPGVPQPPPVPASRTDSAPHTDVPLTPTRRKGFLGSVLRRNSSSFVAGSPVDSQHPRSPSTMRSPKQPKLQRRTTPQNWPLPASTNGGADTQATSDARPTTSDGVPTLKKTMRPDMARRSLSGNDLKNMGDPGSPAKKKKFSRLRKVFGLHD